MPDKLTDNEIKKAREVSLKEQIEHYNERLKETLDSYYRRKKDKETEDTLEICVLLESAALISKLESIINRLQGENEKNENIIRIADKTIETQRAEIENLKDILYDDEGVNLVNYWHQQCEIAENGNRNFDKENKRLKAEIERLEERIIEIQRCGKELIETLHKVHEEKIKTVKAEAYKECIEKVKSVVGEMVNIMFDDNESNCKIDNCRYTSNVPCGNEVCLTANRAFWNSKLDNLLNELVGEENG